MGSLDRPKLRPLAVHRLEHEGRVFAALEDPLGVFANAVLVPIDGFQTVVRHFDGESSLAQIQSRIRLETGQLISTAELEHLVFQLDRAMVLDGPTFSAFQRPVRPRDLCVPRRSPAVRTPAPSSRCRAQLGRFFADAQGAGIPDGQHRRCSITPPRYRQPAHRLPPRRAGLHLGVQGARRADRRRRRRLRDPRRRPPVLRPPIRADPQGLRDPAGPRADRPRRTSTGSPRRAGAHLFDDELAHRTEHSIEFQVVFLQYPAGRPPRRSRSCRSWSARSTT